MTMTPDETLNQAVWWVLKELYKEKLASLSPEEVLSFEYQTSKYKDSTPSLDDQRRAIRVLGNKKAIQILNNKYDNPVVSDSMAQTMGIKPIGVELKILNEFDKTYEEYKKACDLTTYLNNYQEKMVKGEDLPEFSQINHTTDEKGSKQVVPIKRHKGKMFETGGGGGYYNRNHPPLLRKKQSANEIVNGFSSSNYTFVLMVAEGVLSASEFGSDREVNYKLQSAPGQMLMQERQLLSKFEELGLLRHLGEDGIFAVATLRDVDVETIRQIATEIRNRQVSLQIKPKDQSEDPKIRYNQLLEEINIPNQTSPLKQRYDKVLGEIKSSSTPQSRRGLEKKWDTLQAIWTVYESNSRADAVFVPIARLIIKGRDVEEIDGIIEGLRKEGCFENWERKERHYSIGDIDHQRLPEVFDQTGEAYKKLASNYQATAAQPPTSNTTTLSGSIISFDDKEARILVGNTICQLPPYKNEHYLCSVMFKKKVNQPVDWSVVYEKMSGDYETRYGKPPKTREHWRSVYDTMLRINDRIKNKLSTTDELFSWQELTIKRNF